MVKPVNPNEVEQKIPDFVIEAFNDLIAENMHEKSSEVKQDEAVKLIISKARKLGKRIQRHDVFDKGWLDVEKYFRNAGWKVVYDKPAYYETYEAYFTFTKP